MGCDVRHLLHASRHIAPWLWHRRQGYAEGADAAALYPLVQREAAEPAV
jgi:hypothetical protein